MLTRKKTYNNIARSVRSKPSHLVYLFFFPKNGTKIRMKDIEQNIFTIIIIIIYIYLEYGDFEPESAGNIEKVYFSVFDNKLRLQDIYRRKRKKTLILTFGSGPLV